ncbi:endonuclease domain-containing protein [Hyphomicrobium sp. 1Nfss2.1]|uniref:endonuclease domain-containing protein n=1 Tax=Hyphomicrobium sp. 1Nfss2.1 TaxID=3413936 RepID=UPI003C7B362F
MASERARAMRKAPTQGERELWQLVRKRQISGCSFRRQASIGPFIVDFVCLERRIIVEVDGSSHEDPTRRARDAERDRWLERQGFHVLRLLDGEVLENPEAALQRIRDYLGVASDPLPDPPP